jgi:hypothetical protein
MDKSFWEWLKGKNLLLLIFLLAAVSSIVDTLYWTLYE